MAAFPSDCMFRQVTIIGVGLLGGSLGLVLKEKGLAQSVVGIGRRRENLELALQMGAIDSFASTPQEAVSQSDLIVLATPVDTYLSQIKTWGKDVVPGTIVSDVGSVKGDLVFGSSGYGDGGSALLRISSAGRGRVRMEEVYYKRNNEVQNHHGGMVLIGDHIYMGHGNNTGLPL